MASLSPPFILCPLTDRRTLLGMRPDRLQNKVVITLGRNIAIRYHILEQKQESSWTTSRYWFTNPVTFCYDLGKYAAVLNTNLVGLWNETDASLSEFTKVKLGENAFDILSKHDERTVVVMKNGKVAYLSDLMSDNRILKKPLLDPKQVLIVSAEVDHRNNRCYLITKGKNAPGKAKAGVDEITVFIVGIGREDGIIGKLKFGDGVNQILGFCISVGEMESSAVHFPIDGHIYKTKIGLTSGEKVESMKLSNLDQLISTYNEVIMCPLEENSSSIAIYGCNCSEEGAIVLIYDIQYDIVVSKQPLKLYSVPPFMEKIGQSLFVPHGLHVLVLNYRVTKSLLSSMVGKHQAQLNEEVFEGRNPWQAKSWNEDHTQTKSIDISKTDEFNAIKEAFPNIWETIQQAKIFESEGQPEAVICNHVIPTAIEKRNEEALDWILNTFLDIPEVHIVNMTVFSLQHVSLEEEHKSVERLNTLLVRKFDKHLLTQSLRHVDYEDIKKLLFYINGLIRTQWHLDPEEEEDEESAMASWLKWCSALLDAHYTKFVFHSDTKIIDNLLDTLSECTNVMKDITEMEPYLVMTYSKNSFEPAVDTTQRWRTETVVFE